MQVPRFNICIYHLVPRLVVGLLCIFAFSLTPASEHTESPDGQGNDPCSTLYSEKYAPLARIHIKRLLTDKNYRSYQMINSRLDSMDPDVMFLVVLHYLDDVLADKKIKTKMKRRLRVFRRSWCQYQIQDVPENGLDFNTLAETLGFNLEYDPYFKEVHPDFEIYIHEEETADFLFENNKFLAVFNYAVTYLMRTVRYTLYDQDFMERLSFLLGKMEALAENPSVLELAAGRGDIAKALRQRGHDVKAVDDFSDPYFKKIDNPEGLYGVDRGDIYEDKEHWDNYDLTLSFYAPGSSRLLDLYQHENSEKNKILRKRIMVLVHRFSGIRNEVTLTEGNDNKYYLKIQKFIGNFPVPNVYGLESTKILIAISDVGNSIDEARQKASYYLKMLSDLEKQLKQLLDQQNRKAPLPTPTRDEL